MIDYFELQTALRAAESVTAPAECHGIAVGLFSAGQAFAPELWFDHLFGSGYELNAAVVVCAQLLRDLAVEVDRQLRSDSFEIEVLLPEAGSLPERVEALAEWCQGFLLGIALAQVGALDDLPPESREFVHDLSDIARAAAQADEDGEADEQAYLELVEYVRVGVLIFRGDILTIRRPNGGRANG